MSAFPTNMYNSTVKTLLELGTVILQMTSLYNSRGEIGAVAKGRRVVQPSSQTSQITIYVTKLWAAAQPSPAMGCCAAHPPARMLGSPRGSMWTLG